MPAVAAFFFVRGVKDRANGEMEVETGLARIFSPHYTAESLLLDTEILGPIPGLSDLWRMLKTNSAQAKGFRYELEGAAAISRGAMGNDVVVTELSKRISVSLYGGPNQNRH